MITITKYPEQRVNLFSPDEKLIDEINGDELIDVQRQICEQELSGYYIMFNEKKIEINSNGEINEWPRGMFDTSQKLFSLLFHARKNKREQK